MDKDDMTEEMIDKRKRLYESIHNHKKEIPDKWDINSQTIYSSYPTFEREFKGKTVMLRLGINDGDDDEVTAMYAIEEEQQQSWNYNLGHRWKFDNPEQAGIGLIETVIPFIETEVVKD